MHTLSSAFRSFFRFRLTAAAALCILTVGIAANLIIFALVNALLFRPLVFPDAKHLVALIDTVNGVPAGISWGEVEEFRRVAGLFTEAAAYSRRSWALTDHTASGVAVAQSGMVTPTFFQALDVRATLGSLFTIKDGESAEVVLSYKFWQERYGGSSSIIGSALSLNDTPYMIVGVLPQSFVFSIEGDIPDLYIPLRRKVYCCQTQARSLYGIARLSPKISLAAANNRLAILAKTIAQTENLKQFNTKAVSLQTFLAGAKGRNLLLLWLSVFALGLIAALNAGALLLAHSLKNLQAYAVKISLGARFRHLLYEQLFMAASLGVLSALASLAVAGGVLHLLDGSTLLVSLSSHVTRSAHIPIDWRVLLFSLVLAFCAASIACVLPLILLTSAVKTEALRTHAGISASQRGRRLRSVLTVMQLTLSITLLSAIGSFAHSLHAVLDRDPGFRMRHIIVAGIGVPEARYNTDDRMIAFHEQALDSIRTIPGVRNAAFGAGIPVHPYRTAFLLDGTTVPSAERPRVAFAAVSPEMFAVLDLPILRGRNFAATDRLDTPRVVIVNQSFAKRYLDPNNPFGQGMRVSFYNGESMKPWSHFEVVGIVADSRSVDIDQQPMPEIYVSTQQMALEGGHYFLNTTRPADSLMRDLPAAIWRVDRQIQRVIPSELHEWVDSGIQERRAGTLAVLGFALVAILLAVAGLAANSVATVSEKTREIGIRSALGESRVSISTRVVRKVAQPVAIGTAFGLVTALALSRVFTMSVDKEIRFDSWIVLPLSALLVLIAAAVSIIPVRRTLEISPASALRTE